ncbi:hypothetical protein [Kurthia sibirica]|uniref:Uncharacterized protein n=1 Tax=Kurthia sibirica TaxID=202750 RepID=A0A2U3ADY4_9BACL|nr:hypothetical protein [Kurthia sibirica]PWI22746.1 hypothetical protein DEX24_16725 [Kurthia sibirica]GEK35692.1 hypothetical protein KSI01_32250 [Kurthia sibirica]
MATTFGECIDEIARGEFEIRLTIPPVRKMTPAEEERYHREAKRINQMLINSEDYKEQQKELSVWAKQLEKDRAAGIGVVDMKAIEAKYYADKAEREANNS